MRAPEFPDNLTWFNSDPLKIKDLRGRVVLIDFWTYSCLNCIRAQPHLNEWWKKYKDKGLVVIGVHTPEFEFEKQSNNVAKAILELDINYPVVMDNDYKIWNLYSNHWWPRKFLVNKDGKVIYDHIGEGGYRETEERIQKELKEIDAKDLPDVAADVAPGGGVCYQTTPEIYLGFLRANYGHWLAENRLQNYEDLGKHKADTSYLSGIWIVRPEYIQHGKNTESYRDYLLLNFKAFSVNLVMNYDAKGKSEVLVELNGRAVPKEKRGADLIEKENKTYLMVQSPRMYRIIEADEYLEAELKLYVKDDKTQMYALTFGGCAK